MNKKQLFPVALALLAVIFCPVSRAEPSPKPELGTGLEGVIAAGPTRGGPSRVGVPDSSPVANTAFVVKKENELIASFTTDDQGRFRISLPAGHYTVSRKEPAGKIGHYGPFEVDVTEGQVKKVQWSCDTGMR